MLEGEELVLDQGAGGGGEGGGEGGGSEKLDLNLNVDEGTPGGEDQGGDEGGEGGGEKEGQQPADKEEPEVAEFKGTVSARLRGMVKSAPELAAIFKKYPKLQGEIEGTFRRD